MVSFNFKDKVVIITGAGSGIGRATAIEFAKSGAFVYLIDKSEKTLIETAHKIKDMGKNAAYVKVDVSIWEEVEKMANLIKKEQGRIDVLVNNAGIASTNKASWVMPTLEIDIKEWKGVLATNLNGQFFCAKAVIPIMMKQRSGNIVNVSSSVAFTGAVGSVAYCASKAGVIGLTRHLARELGPYNIKVNCIAPGLILTPMQEGIPEEAINEIVRRIPLRRAGTAEDVARIILFLSCEELYMTGQTIIIDGGNFMH